MAGLEGRTLDRYELRQLIGRGGMADVYLGYDPRFERTVAVKVFKRDDEEMLRRFIREARLMASLRHAHLMPIYDAGDRLLDGINQYYIVMPLMEGGTLRTRTKRAPLSPDEACRYLRQIADALDYIHQRGIVHRDIKSSNVLLDAEGRCYLSDFGIARTETDATQLTVTGGVLGTVDYVAPELFEEDRKADARSDLYSLGVLLFEMVTGRLPFTAENQIALVAMHINRQPPSPRKLAPALTVETEQVILRALEKRPERRYESATQLAEAFCRSLTARSVEGPAAVVWDVPTRVSPHDGKVVAQQPSRVAGPPATPPLSSLPVHSTQGYRAVSDSSRVPPQASMQAPLQQSQSIPSKRSSSPTRTRRSIVAVLALLALLAVVAPIVFVLANRSSTGNNPVPTEIPSITQAQSTATPTPTTNATATAQAVAATATQQAKQGTATAVAVRTATAQAQVTATANAIQTVTAGTVLYEDALNSASNPATQQADWDQTENCAFRGDGYHVSIGTFFGRGQAKGCREAGKSFTDATISVDMKILSGIRGGVFFRVDTDALNTYRGYLFEVDPQGKYRISQSDNFTTGSITLKEGRIKSDFKRGLNVKNRLLISARGGDLTFFVNNVSVDTLRDSTFSSGNIALLAASADDGPNGETVYSNLKVVAPVS
jgi:serine/threonine protein kinase